MRSGARPFQTMATIGMPLTTTLKGGLSLRPYRVIVPPVKVCVQIVATHVCAPVGHWYTPEMELAAQ